MDDCLAKFDKTSVCENDKYLQKYFYKEYGRGKKI